MNFDEDPRDETQGHLWLAEIDRLKEQLKNSEAMKLHAIATVEKRDFEIACLRTALGKIRDRLDNEDPDGEDFIANIYTIAMRALGEKP